VGTAGGPEGGGKEARGKVVLDAGFGVGRIRAGWRTSCPVAVQKKSLKFKRKEKRRANNESEKVREKEN